MTPSKNWLKEEAKAFLKALTFPFQEKGFWRKTPVFMVAAFIPLVNLLLLRGWRLELTKNLSWKEAKILPSSAVSKIVSYILTGAKLWFMTGVYLLIPIILISLLGLRGIGPIAGYIKELFSFLWDYFNGVADQGLIAFGIGWMFRILFKGVAIFLIENIWLIIYLPMYRIGMIRYAVTGNLLTSHLSIRKNLRFLWQHKSTIALMYGLFFLEAVAAFIISTLLSLTVILIPLIPSMILFVGYWSSGYDFGLLGQKMVEGKDLEKLHPRGKINQP